MCDIDVSFPFSKFVLKVYSVLNAMVFCLSCSPMSWHRNIKHFSATSGMFREYYINTMTADTIAPNVIISSATMLLTMWDRQPHVFSKKLVQLPATT